MYKAILVSQNIWTLLGRFFLRNIHITKFILELESQLIILFSKSWWYDSYIRFVSQHYTNLNRTTSTSLLCRHFYVVLTPKLFFFLFTLQMHLLFVSISLCIICVLGDRTFCEQECYPYRTKCHTDCRKDYMSNSFKKKFQACSKKCEAEFRKCDDTCECKALNKRERAGCRHSCKNYVYLNDFDRKQCLIECKFDFSENYSKCWRVCQLTFRVVIMIIVDFQLTIYL